VDQDYEDFQKENGMINGSVMSEDEDAGED
jgi:hypothetical protein